MTRTSHNTMLLALAALLAMVAGPAAHADTFGSGGNQFTLNFATISAAANPADTSPSGGYGVVNYDYRIGATEITNDQWNKFKASLGYSLTGSPWYAYDPTVTPFFTGGSVPVNSISWYQAAQFVNWLNTSTGRQAAYNFTGTPGTSNYTFTTWSPSQAAGGTNLYRNKDALYFLPNEDEWVKAAYFNGTTLQTHATQSGQSLTQGNGASGTGWDYYSNGYATTTPGPWNVGSGSQELNGTRDMMGNVWEWMESPATPGDYGADAGRGMRGGSFNSDATALGVSARGSNVNPPLPNDPGSGYSYDLGFRVAALMPPTTLTWTGSASGTWDVATTANFSNSGTPSTFHAGDAVIFDDTGTNTAITIAAGGVSPSTVQFSNTTAKNYALSGGPINGAATLLVSGSGQVTLNNANANTGGTTVSAGTLRLGVAGAIPDNTPVTVSGGTLDLGGFTVTTSAAVSFAAGTTQNGVIVNNGASYSGQAGAVSVALQGSAGMSKSGSGTLTLSGANTYNGATTVSAGILRAGVASVAGTSGAFGNNSAVTLTNAAGVALDIAGYDTQIGSLAGGGASGGNVTLGANTLTVGSNNTNTTFSGSISSSGSPTVSLVKTGSGNLQLTRANTYTGRTVINGGALVLWNGVSDPMLGAVPASFQADNVSINNGGMLWSSATNDGNGTLNANRGIYLGAGTQYFRNDTYDFTINGVISGPGGLTKNAGGGYQIMVLNAANTYSGDTRIGGGTLRLGNNLALQNSPYDTSSPGSLDWNGRTAVTFGGLFSASNLTAASSVATFTLNLGSGVTKTFSGTLTRSGTTGMNVTKTGPGTQVFGGSNTYTGTTTVNQGVLRLASANALPGGIAATGGTSALSINGGVVELANNDFLRNVGAGATQFQITGGASGFSAYNAPRAVTVNNSAATELVWGSATFAPSTLVLNETTANNTLALNNKIDLGGATRTVAVNANTATIAGVIRTASGTAGLTKTGAGTLALAAANIYNGPTTINGGTLALGSSGSINNSSGIAIAAGATYDVSAVSGYALAQPLSAKGAGTANVTGALSAGAYNLDMQDATNLGILAFSSGLTLGSGTWKFDLGSSTADKITVAGAATVGGTTHINLGSITGATSLATGVDAYTLATAASGLGSGFTLDTTSLTVNGTVYALQLDPKPTGLYLSVSTGNNSSLTLPGTSLTLNVHKDDITTTVPTTVTNGGTDSSHFTPTSTGSDALTLNPSVSTAIGAGPGATAGVTARWTSTGTAGARSGQITIANDDNGSDSATPKTQTVAGGVYNLASTSFSTTSVNLGLIHANGSFTTAALSIDNTLPAGTYNETLGAQFANASGVTTGGSPITVAAGAAANTSMTVNLSASTATAGHKSGTVDVQFDSQEVNSSGLGTTSRPALNKTITVGGDVFGGSATWALSSGPSGSWGSGASANWSGAAGVNAAPGTFAGYDNVDAATFDGTGTTATVNLDAAAPSLKSLSFSGGTSYEIAQGTGGNKLTLKSDAGSATVAVAGVHAVSAPVTLASNAAVTVTGGGDKLTLGGAVDGAGSLTLGGAGTLALGGSNFSSGYSGGTTAGGGTLQLDSADALRGGSNLTLSGAAKATLGGSSTVNLGNAVKLADLNLNAHATSGLTATMDLNKSKLIVDKTQVPLATIRSQIKSAYAGSTWTGAGVTSSAAAADRAVNGTAARTGVGYLDNALAAGQGGGKTTWQGRNVDSNSLLVRYTYYGDCNLDGAVNLADFGLLKANYGTGSHWYQGDFDYSGTVNLADFGKLKAAYGMPLISAAAAVPEPGALAMLGVLAPWWLARRFLHRKGDAVRSGARRRAHQSFS